MSEPGETPTNFPFNPYDFANPVQDPSLFVGREGEIHDIEYYLQQTKHAPQAINLAVIGPRASGKTSLLNMIERKAKERELHTLRVDLDEADVQDALSFFYCLLDGLVTQVCENGLFGGVTGDVYLTYRDCVDAHEVPESKMFCPFIFPIQYARSMSAGARSHVSNQVIKTDLERIYQEVGAPIVLLFDECNVLSAKRELLEKLRNLFMRLSGYMLVMAGTDEFFPVMDEVFSPIIRQFKKLEVRPFHSIRATGECLRAPLRLAGFEDTYSVLDRRTEFEVHRLSGGRPYEIQLLGHFLFRAVQEERTDIMRINMDVLETVRKELETGTDLKSRPVIGSIRGAPDRPLEALDWLTTCEGSASLEDLWSLEYALMDEVRWSRSELTDLLDYWVRQGVLEVDDQDRIVFTGDDFDRLYCKYYCRQTRDISLSINNTPIDRYASIKVSEYFEKVLEIEELDPLRGYFGGLGPGEGISIDRLADVLSAMQDPARANPFDTDPDVAEVVYRRSMVSSMGKLGVLWISYLSEGQGFGDCFLVRRQDEVGDALVSLDETSSYLSEIEGLVSRGAEVGVTIESAVFGLELPSVEVVHERLLGSSNQQTRGSLGRWHRFRAADFYLDDMDTESGIREAWRSVDLDIQPDGANTLGYLLIKVGEIEEARKVLIKGQELSSQDSAGDLVGALLSYNLGMCSALMGDPVAGERHFSVAESLAAPISVEEGSAACLFVPELVDESVQWNEEFGVNVREAAGIARGHLAGLHARED